MVYLHYILELQTTSFFMLVSTGWFQITTLKNVGKSPNIHSKSGCLGVPRIMLTDICNITYLEPQTTIYQWMFGETTIFYIKIWNHPSETTIYRWLFGVPGINITIICSFVPFCFQVYFGGRGRTGCFRDLHALDTSSHTWCRGAWESWRGTRRWYRDN